jgi:hypothetical protein
MSKTKVRTKEHNNGQTFSVCIRHLSTNRDRKQINIFERKVCRIILGPIYDKKKVGGY